MDAQVAELDRLITGLSVPAKLANSEANLDAAAKNHPDATLIGLARCANLSESADNRAQALILLKRLAFRPGDHGVKGWTILDPASHQLVQDQLIQCIVAADTREAAERHVACDTAAAIHEALEEVDERWPQLVTTAIQAIQQPAPQQRESGLLILAALSHALVAHLTAGGLLILQHIANALRLEQGHAYVSLAAFETAASLLSDWPDAVKALWTGMVDALQQYSDPDDIDSALKILVATLAEPDVLTALATAGQIQPLLALCVAQIGGSGIDDDNRQQWIEVGVTIAETAAENVADLGADVYEGFILALLHVMTEVKEDPDWSKAEIEDEEDDSAHATAEAALDRLAQALDDELVLPTLFTHVGPLVKSEDWRQQYAGLSAIASIPEGCGEGLEALCGQIIELITPSFSNGNPRVRHAAIYALAQLCSYLDGQVQKDHAEAALTLLVNALGDPEARIRAWASAAAVNFLDLEVTETPALMPLLQTLYERLYALASSDAPHVAARAFSALSALAVAAASITAGHYAQLMPLLLHVLEQPGQSVSHSQSSAMDCVGAVAKAVGPDVFASAADGVFKHVYALYGRAKADDDRANAADALTAITTLTTVAQQQAAPYTPGLVGALVELANKTIEVEHGGALDGDLEVVQVGDDIFGIDPDEVEVKAGALENLSDLAVSLGAGFAPFAQDVLNAALPLLKFYFSDVVRQAAAALLPSIVQVARDAAAPEADQKRLVNHISTSLVDVLAKEDDPTVASAFFEHLATVYTLAPGHLDAAGTGAFVTAVEAQLQKLSVRSSLRSDNDPSDADVEEGAASDDALLEACSSAIKGWFGQSPPAMALGRLQGYAVSFAGSIDLAAKRWSLRFAVDLVLVQGARAAEAIAPLLPSLVEAVSSLDPEVRRAACYGVGVLAEYGAGAFDTVLTASIDALTRALAPVANTGHHEADELAVFARDNAISALGKILRFAPHAVDTAALTPRWVASLPIELDGEEMEAAYALLLDLIAKGHEAVSPSIPVIAQRIVAILAFALHGDAASRLPPACAGPIRIGLQHYLAVLPASYRDELVPAVRAQLQ